MNLWNRIKKVLGFSYERHVKVPPGVYEARIRKAREDFERRAAKAKIKPFSGGLDSERLAEIQKQLGHKKLTVHFTGEPAPGKLPGLHPAPAPVPEYREHWADDDGESLDALAPAMKHAASSTGDMGLEFERAKEKGRERMNENMEQLRPDYYRTEIDLIDAWAALFPPNEFRAIMKSHIMKYTFRYNEKGGLRDLEKAEEFIGRLKAWEEAEECIGRLKAWEEEQE